MKQLGKAKSRHNRAPHRGLKAHVKLTRLIVRTSFKILLHCDQRSKSLLLVGLQRCGLQNLRLQDYNHRQKCYITMADFQNLKFDPQGEELLKLIEAELPQMKLRKQDNYGNQEYEPNKILDAKVRPLKAHLQLNVCNDTTYNSTSAVELGGNSVAHRPLIVSIPKPPPFPRR